LEYWEFRGEKKKYFSWVTDFILARENVYQIMRGGRARWKIESAPQAHGKEARHELTCCA
jgi:hypothetical protein